LITVDYWSPTTGLVRSTKSITFTFAGAGSLNLPVKANTDPSGYYGFSYTISSQGANDTNIYFNMGNTGPNWCHRCIPGMERNLTSVSSTRILAVELMYSNRENGLVRGGSVTGLQVNEGDHWMDYISITNNNKDTYAAVVASNDMVEMESANGMHCFLRPNDPEDFDFQSDYEITNNILYDSHYSLEGSKSFLVLVVNEPVPTVAIGTSRAGKWTLGFGMEYQTTDMFRSILPPPTGMAKVQEKMFENLSKIPQFTENPRHIMDILRAVRSGVHSFVNGVIKWGPRVMKVAEFAKNMMETAAEDV